MKGKTTMTRQEVNTMMVEWMIQFTDEFINDSILPNYNEITNDKAFLLLLVLSSQVIFLQVNIVALVQVNQQVS